MQEFIWQAKRTLPFPKENGETEANNVSSSTNDPKRQKQGEHIY
jgi:hypothetical protein